MEVSFSYRFALVMQTQSNELIGVISHFLIGRDDGCCTANPNHTDQIYCYVILTCAIILNVRAMIRVSTITQK